MLYTFMYPSFYTKHELCFIITAMKYIPPFSWPLFLSNKIAPLLQIYSSIYKSSECAQHYPKEMCEWIPTTPNFHYHNTEKAIATDSSLYARSGCWASVDKPLPNPTSPASVHLTPSSFYSPVHVLEIVHCKFWSWFDLTTIQYGILQI